MPPEAIGKASGTNLTLRQLGGVLGIALAVAVFAGAGSYASPQAFTDGFDGAMIVAVGLSLAGALAGSLLPGRATFRVPSGAMPAFESEGS